MYTYKLIEDENPLFSFVTDSGIKYVLELLKQNFDNIYFKDLYILSFYPVIQEGVKLTNDIKIKATISQIIIDFLDVSISIYNIIAPNLPHQNLEVFRLQN